MQFSWLSDLTGGLSPPNFTTKVWLPFSVKFALPTPFQLQIPSLGLESWVGITNEWRGTAKSEWRRSESSFLHSG